LRACAGGVLARGLRRSSRALRRARLPALFGAPAARAPLRAAEGGAASVGIGGSGEARDPPGPGRSAPQSQRGDGGARTGGDVDAPCPRAMPAPGWAGLRAALARSLRGAPAPAGGAGRARAPTGGGSAAGSRDSRADPAVRGARDRVRYGSDDRGRRAGGRARSLGEASSVPGARPGTIPAVRAALRRGGATLAPLRPLDHGGTPARDIRRAGRAGQGTAAARRAFRPRGRRTRAPPGARGRRRAAGSGCGGGAAVLRRRRRRADARRVQAHLRGRDGWREALSSGAVRTSLLGRGIALLIVY